jgi:hypothetical protein
MFNELLDFHECIVLDWIYCIQVDPVTGEKQVHRPWI